MNYYLGVNEEIRNATLAALRDKNISKAELARRLGVPRQNISRAFSEVDPQGKVPPLWVKILEEAGLELTVKPRPDAPERDA